MLILHENQTMAEQKKNDKHSIHLKYRISVINEDTFDEVRRVRLSVFNIVLFVALTLLVASAIVVSLIFYTPIKEYVPGYPDSETRASMVNNAQLVDSLIVKLNQNEMYLEGVRQILTGDIPEELYADSSAQRNKEVIMERVRLQASDDEKAFRAQVENEEQYNLSLLDKAGEVRAERTVFFSPVKGMITERFDPKKGHFGLDIATKEREHILAVSDGTVILVDYSITAGNVISIQHTDNIISTYRHASSILKKTGAKIKAGEAIAIVGNTGTLSTGVHLHLELWKDGEAVDPETLIVF